MKKYAPRILAAFITLAASASSQAINANYARKLERAGCTQTSELQGCDINKTREENAKAGFGKNSSESSSDKDKTPYAGDWLAKTTDGATVASIRIDGKNQVWVNDQRVKARLSDGGLVFKQGFVTYMIQGDRRRKDEDYWTDSDARTRGPIHGR